MRREDLSDQLTSAAGRRRDLVAQLPDLQGVAREGLEQRIRVLDDRIVQLESELAETGRMLTNAPTSALVPPRDGPGFLRDLDPGQMTAVSIIFTVVVLGPIAIATARRILRSAPPAPRRSRDEIERLERLEQAVDTIAVEIERVAEGQRFVTRILSQTNGAGVLASLAPDEPARRIGEPLGDPHGET